MIVYVVVIFVVLSLFLLELNVKSEKERRLLFFVGAFLITFILAFRGENVGGDMIDYCEYYNGRGGVYGTVDNPSEGFGIGFIAFSHLLRLLFGDSSFVFIFVTSLMTILPFLYLVWRDSKCKLLPLCLYMTYFSLLTLSQTCIRQNISMFFLFMLYIVLSRRQDFSKWIYLFVPFLFICAILCHTTSVISIALAIFVFCVPMNKTLAFLLIIASALFIVTIPNFTDVLLEQFFFYFSVVDEAQHFVDYQFVGGLSRSARFLSIMIMAQFMCFYIYLCSPSQFKGGRIKTFPLKCLIWGVVISFFSSGFQLGPRIVLFLIFLGITASPERLLNKSYLLFNLGFTSFILYFVYSTIKYLAFAKSAIDYDQLVPYNFIFE